MDPRKEAICNALAAFIRQRPGMEPRNYGSWASYSSEARPVARDKRDAETLLLAVRSCDGITADAMLAAADGRGRLRIHRLVTDKPYGPHSCDSGGDYVTFRPEWTTGQYWPVEFRAGTARYLAGLLWDHARDNRPTPGEGFGTSSRHDGLSAGDWLRRHFRKLFGSALQKRYFD